MVYDEAKMREAGFTDHREDYWYYTTRVGDDTSWNATINKATGVLELVVLDEWCLQPYPFEELARQGLPFAQNVRTKVLEQEAWLDNVLKEARTR